MHALRHVHRLLVPRGTLVDLHPLTERHVEAGGKPIGVIEEPEFAFVDLGNAETRLREAIDDGLFTIEAETEFDFLEHFDHADELVDATEADLTAQPELVRRIRAAAPPLVSREHVVLRRLECN